MVDNSRGWSLSLAGKAWQRECGATHYTTPRVRKSRYMNIGASLCLDHSRTLPMEWCLSFSWPYQESASQSCPKVVFLGDSRSCKFTSQYQPPCLANTNCKEGSSAHSFRSWRSKQYTTGSGESCRVHRRAWNGRPEVMTSGQSQTQGCGAMFFVELINERLMKNILSLSRIWPRLLSVLPLSSIS